MPPAIVAKQRGSNSFKQRGPRKTSVSFANIKAKMTLKTWRVITLC
jgi:hypothetical protein